MSSPAVVIVEGETFTLPNPQEFKSMLTAHGASGLKKKGDPSAMVYNGLGMLTPGSDYTYAYGKGSVWAKLEGARKTHQGTLDRLTDFCEKDVSHGTPRRRTHCVRVPPTNQPAHPPH